MRVVIDCNILVISLTSRSPYHNIFQALVKGNFDLILSSEIMLEYHEIIERKYGLNTAESFSALLCELPNVDFIKTYYQWNLIEADADDNKYCDCAVAGKADFIVTEDKHFNVLANVPFPPIKAISIDEFSETLRKLSD